MQSLHHAHRITRFVLLWFVLSLGVAIAAPLVQPQGLQLVCSGSGASKVIVGDADAQRSAVLQVLHCPLCAGIDGPPPLDILAFTASAPLGYALPLHPRVQMAPLAGTAPPPARGPPTPA
jgi:hypothetical protein